MKEEKTEQELSQEKATLIINRLKAGLPAILENRPVLLAYVYGSVARGGFTPISDVDIALVLKEPLPPREQLLLELDIGADIADHCGIMDADVRSINDAPLVVRGTVACEGILLYSRDEEARIEFLTTTWSRYFDFQPIAELHRRAFFKRLRQEGLLRGRSKED